MNLQQRSDAVEKNKGCPRCTSWAHPRLECKIKPNKCGANLGTGTCSGDHSKLLHGSSNVYCAALDATVMQYAASDDNFSCVKENAEIVFFLQDIPVRKSANLARESYVG